jgi:sugar phosphate isomerase/epimerase
MTDDLTRRDFLRRGTAAGAAAAAAGLAEVLAAEKARPKRGSKMRLGLVTYLWAKDWPLPTLIANCEKAGVLGVELRTTHKHGVERTLSAGQRAEVKKRFDDSPVTHVGIGSNERFDHPDPAKLQGAIEATKAFIQLSRDCGGSGVKVKPNSFQKGVPREKTIEQIGRSLNVVGKFGAEHGQQIRLEVHGQCAELGTIKQIMDVATHPNVGVCWNSNATDLKGKGLEHNFNLVKARFGATAHVRAFDNPGNTYPWQKLIDLFVGMDYAGWVLLEARAKRKDYVAALARQKKLFQQMVVKAQGGV